MNTASDRRYRINAPLAVSEIIDGEAVIMNLDSGHYFSARDVAGVLWEWTIAGHSVDAMAAAAASAWPGSSSADDLPAFIAQLLEHALIAPISHGAPASAPDIGDAAGTMYQMPRLDVFTDMKDLLLLDPIHDVGTAGWPMPKELGEQDAA